MVVVCGNLGVLLPFSRSIAGPRGPGIESAAMKLQMVLTPEKSEVLSSLYFFPRKIVHYVHPYITVLFHDLALAMHLTSLDNALVNLSVHEINAVGVAPGRMGLVLQEMLVDLKR